jgi:hypothetical protein
MLLILFLIHWYLHFVKISLTLSGTLFKNLIALTTEGRGKLTSVVCRVKLPAYRAGLPGNENLIIRSAFLPAPATGRKAGHPADLPVTSGKTI